MDFAGTILVINPPMFEIAFIMSVRVIEKGIHNATVFINLGH